MGIEPTLSAWEAEVLPLNYTRIINLQYFPSLAMDQLFNPFINAEIYHPLSDLLLK